MKQSYLLLKLTFLFLLLGGINQILSAQTLEITAQVDKTDILTGEDLKYTLKYKCASTTTNCSAVTIVAAIPSGIYILGQTIGLTSDIASYVVAADNKSVTFTFKDPLTAGNTGIIEFNGRGQLGLPDGTIGTLTADIKTAGTTAASASVATTLHSYNAFCPQKAGGQGLALDNTTLYSINLGYAVGFASGVTNAGPVTVVDQMPVGAIIDSVVVFSFYASSYPQPIGTCAVDNATNKITCSIPASSMMVDKLNGYTPQVYIRVYARYPSGTFTAGQNVTNSVTVTHTPEGSSTPITLAQGSVVSFQSPSAATYATLGPKTCTTFLDVTDVLAVPAPKLTISKTSSVPDIKPGEASYYDLFIENKGNVSLNDIEVEDIIPADIEVTKITASYFSNLRGGEVIQHWYKTVNNPTYTLITFLYNEFVIPVGEKVTAIKLTANTLPPGSSDLYTPFRAFYNLSATTMATSVTNCMTVTTSTAGTTIDDTKKCNTMNIKPLDAFSTLRLNKGLSPYKDGGTLYQVPQLAGTSFWSGINARVLGGGQPLQKPIVADLLPKGLDYEGQITYRQVPTITPPADTTEIIPNYNGTGRTLIRLKWANAWPGGSDYYINIKTKIMLWQLRIVAQHIPTIR